MSRAGTDQWVGMLGRRLRMAVSVGARGTGGPSRRSPLRDSHVGCSQRLTLQVTLEGLRVTGVRLEAFTEAGGVAVAWSQWLTGRWRGT